MSANAAFSTTLDFEFFAGGLSTLAGEASVLIETSFVSYAKVSVAGSLNSVLDFSSSSTAVIPFNSGSAQNLSFDFTVNSIAEFTESRFAAAELGSLVIPFSVLAQSKNIVKANLSSNINFESNSFVEFGVQLYAAAELGSLVIPFSVSAQSKNIAQAYLNSNISFESNSFVEYGIQRFATTQLGALTIPFTQSAQGYNVTHAYLNKTLDFTLNTEIYVFSLGESAGSYSFSLESAGLNISTRAYSRDGANYYKFNGVNFNEVAINTQSNSVRIIDNGIRQAEVLQK
jgi:hypothetical protein